MVLNCTNQTTTKGRGDDTLSANYQQKFISLNTQIFMQPHSATMHALTINFLEKQALCYIS